MMAKRGLGIPHTETVASFSADFAVNNMAAYEVYLAGLGYFLHFDYRSAERAFRSALELAPDFHMARYRLAHVEVASGDTEAGLATLGGIPDDAPLTRRERFYVDGARALFNRDAARTKAIYSEMLAEFPYDVEARLLLALAHDLAIEDDAAIAELKRLLEQEPQNDYVWSYLGETYLRLGDYENARRALDQYLTLKPRDPYGFTVLGQLYQLTGNLPGAAAHFTHALELEPGFVLGRLSLARTQVLRDAWEDAEQLLRTLAADSETPAAYRIDAAFDLSALLRAQGRFADSLQPLQELGPLIQKEAIREAMGLAERGVAMAELGRFAEADRLIARAIERSPGAPTRYLFARGSVMLMRGDVAGVRAVAAEIRNQKLPQDSPHDAMVVREANTRAAAYLEGMAELVSGNTSAAARALTRVSELPGYQYSIYRLGLGRALLADGKLAQALEMARAAGTERDAGDIRLDLELDRSRALLLEAEVLSASGQRSAATACARDFLRRWKNDDPAQADRLRAERIAGTTATRSGDA
jgi:tetratricopeptide (TPR) repeat protein